MVAIQLTLLINKCSLDTFIIKMCKDFGKIWNIRKIIIKTIEKRKYIFWEKYYEHKKMINKKNFLESNSTSI